MTPEALSGIRHAVCAIGWIGTTSDEFYTDPKRGRFDIEGTGFLVGPRSVVTCAHVMESLVVREVVHHVFRDGLHGIGIRVASSGRADSA